MICVSPFAPGEGDSSNRPSEALAAVRESLVAGGVGVKSLAADRSEAARQVRAKSTVSSSRSAS